MATVWQIYSDEFNEKQLFSNSNYNITVLMRAANAFPEINCSSIILSLIVKATCSANEAANLIFLAKRNFILTLCRILNFYSHEYSEIKKTVYLRSFEQGLYDIMTLFIKIFNMDPKAPTIIRLSQTLDATISITQSLIQDKNFRLCGPLLSFLKLTIKSGKLD
jgi:hypothetical protein